ncbi:YggT family protein [Anaerolineales bacterium]
MDIIGLLVFLLRIYGLILLARVLMSWIPNIDYSNAIVQLLFEMTEPVLRPIRQLMPPTQGIDFSPVIAFVIITLLSTLLMSF